LKEEMMQTNEELKTQKRFGKRAMFAVAVAAVSVTLLVTQSGFLSRPAAKVEASAKKETTTASAGSVVLAAPGRVEGQSEVIEVGASADGVLTDVRVREGQEVAAGQVLAMVDCGDVEAERQAALALG
jgi:multidrug efflux pump subunit AcrA (membrane-fusion protein)